MAESFDITEIATRWIAKFGAGTTKQAEVLSKSSDDTGADWHKTFAAVTQYLLERTPA